MTKMRVIERDDCHKCEQGLIVRPVGLTKGKRYRPYRCDNGACMTQYDVNVDSAGNDVYKVKV